MFLRELLFPLIAVIAAFIVGGILILLVGDNPIEAYRLLLGSALSWPDGIGYTLFYATPLIFTGLAVLVAFRCGYSTSERKGSCMSHHSPRRGWESLSPAGRHGC